MIRIFKISAFILFLFSLQSCERDVLIWHNRELKGKWKWIKTEERSCYYHCSLWQYTISTPSSTGLERILEFKTRGRMFVFENEEKTGDAVLNLKNKNTNWTNGKKNLFEFTATTNPKIFPKNIGHFSGKIYGEMDTLKISYSSPGNPAYYDQYYVRVE